MSSPTFPLDVELTERIQRRLPQVKNVCLGKNAHPDLRTQVEATLLGLHGLEDRYPGVRVTGPIAVRVWEGAFGIDIMNIGERPDYDAMTLTGRGVVLLSERQIINRWNRGVAEGRSRLHKPERFSEFETTLIHEMGHMAARCLHFMQRIDLAERTMDNMGTVSTQINQSDYARLHGPDEFIAEAFVTVMDKGEATHPALVDLVRGVIEYAS